MPADRPRASDRPARGRTARDGAPLADPELPWEAPRMGWLYEEHPGHEIEKAVRQRHRRTVLFIAALGAFLAVASALALVALTQWREATRQGAEAERQGNEARRQSAAARTQLDLGHIERGRQLLWDGYPFQAAPYLAGAYSDGVEHRPLRDPAGARGPQPAVRRDRRR